MGGRSGLLCWKLCPAKFRLPGFPVHPLPLWAGLLGVGHVLGKLHHRKIPKFERIRQDPESRDYNVGKPEGLCCRSPWPNLVIGRGAGFSPGI